MSDTVASVVLAVDILCLIIAVKVLIRLIALLGRLPPGPARRQRRAAAVCADAPGVEFDPRCERDAPCPRRPG